MDTMTEDHATLMSEVLTHFQRIDVVRRLFVSEWYHATARDLDLPSDMIETLDVIATETIDAHHDIAMLLEAWRAAGAPMGYGPLDPRDHAKEVTHLVQEAFVNALIQMKFLSATALQKASLLAPADLQLGFAELSAVDYKHTTALRSILVEIYGATPYPHLARSRQFLPPE
ncbi:MAG TPA: hypothetical protein VM370_01640 [Candidatus Thermoplasmatota archaeon]|nr:hypothetical protein [Candidatus Thermoplasmatota archaeon]